MAGGLAIAGCVFGACGTFNLLVHNIIEIRNLLNQGGEVDPLLREEGVELNSDVLNEFCNLWTLQSLVSRFNSNEITSPVAQNVLIRTVAKVNVINAHIEKFDLKSFKKGVC